MTTNLNRYLLPGQQKLVVIVGGDVGGVGKTEVALAVSDWMRARGLPAHAIDTDQGKSSLYARLGEEACTYLPFILDRDASEEERQSAGDDLIKLIRRHDALLIDMGAGADKQLWDWMREVRFDTTLAKRLGIRPVVLHLISSEQESLVCLRDMLDYGFQSIEPIAVLNHGKGTRFQSYSNSPERERVLSAGGAEIVIPRGPITALNLANNRALPFSDLLARSDEAVGANRFDQDGDPIDPEGGKVLGDGMTFRLFGWLDDIFAELDGIFEVSSDDDGDES